MRTVWHRYYLLSWTLLCLAARAEGEGAATRPQPLILEALKVAAAEEFAAAAQSLRERLVRAQAHDTVGEAVETQALQQHRSRYLDLKRAIEHRMPDSASAADLRSPFVPDFKAPPAAAPIPRTPARRGDWDLYSRESAANPSSRPAAPPWDMYGKTGSQQGEPSTESPLPGADKSSAAQPILVYRASVISPAMKGDVSGLRSVSLHTTEERQ